MITNWAGKKAENNDSCLHSYHTRRNSRIHLETALDHGVILFFDLLRAQRVSFSFLQKEVRGMTKQHMIII